MIRRIPRFPLLLALSLTLFGVSQSQAQEWLQAPAEAANYQQGGTLYQPLMDFVYELESRTELMNVVKLTETLGGRDVVLCVLSNPPVFQPADLAYSDKPVVLIVNNVHGGEVAGKDASMELMRDLVMGDLRPLLDEVVVLVVPTINPDGAEVRRRTNDEGFDMNRDYLKLETQEIQAVVTKLLYQWRPHIHVDTHHGGSAPYVLTFQGNMNPAGDANLMRVEAEEIIPAIRAALLAEDYAGFWYSGPRNLGDEIGWAPTSVEPRKQHVYSTLANTLGFLFETPGGSHRVVDNGTRVVEVPAEERYQHQVRGQYIGQLALIRFAARNPDRVRQVVAQARADAIARGNDDTDNDQIPIEYEQVENFREQFWYRAGGRGGGGAGAGAQPQVQAQFELVEGPILTRWEPTVTVTRPWGYLIPNSLTKVVPLLMQHDITVKQLTEPVELEVETWYATEITGDQLFQGHYLREAHGELRTETLSFPAGTFFIPSGQASSNLISYLLEPTTNDNLLTWGFLDNEIRLTDSAEEVQAQRAALEAQLAGLTAEERAQTGARLERQLEQLNRGQAIPIHRVMHKTNLPGILVQPFNQYEPRLYIRR
ncbi:M14 family zinc carboxypeptidase [Gemmatimonadota bacterium]